MVKTGKVYKIISTLGSEVYIGSTFHKRLCDRMRGHKDNYSEWKKGNSNRARNITSFKLFEKYGFEKCKIILIKEYRVVDKKQLLMYEQLWINKMTCLNERPCFSPLFYCHHLQKVKGVRNLYKRRERHNCARCSEKRRVENKNYNKKYREANKVKLKEKVVCECGLKTSKKHITEHIQTDTHRKKMGLDILRVECDKCNSSFNPLVIKSHRRKCGTDQTNQKKEKAIYQKEYYKKTLSVQSKKQQCGCGSLVRKSGFNAHLKTNKHKKWLGEQQE